MSSFKYAFIYFSVVVCIVLFFCYNLIDYGQTDKMVTLRNRSYINIAVVACGSRYQETLVMIKSALMFTKYQKLNFIIFCEDHMAVPFAEKLGNWQAVTKYDFIFNINKLKFPSDNTLEWKNLFKPCAAQRLFFPSVLEAEDSLLYVDTDVVFLSPVTEIFKHFSKFNSSQIAGLVPEHEDKRIGWYNRFARHPYFGGTGVNSGVMLMNLTRMREFNWEAKLLPLYEEYKLKITWGDQDLINILFYFNPEKLYLMSCNYNYRPDHCMYSNVCALNKTGIMLLHGNRGYFHNLKQPLFKYIYETIEKYQLKDNMYQKFFLPLKHILKRGVRYKNNCEDLNKIIVTQVYNFIHNKEYYQII